MCRTQKGQCEGEDTVRGEIMVGAFPQLVPTAHIFLISEHYIIIWSLFSHFLMLSFIPGSLGLAGNHGLDSKCLIV